MNLLKSFIFSFLCVGFIASPSFAQAVSCHSLFSSEAQVFKAWRPGDKNEFMAFRSNAPHFWAWAHGIASREVPKELLIEGLAAGDVHVLNFGQLIQMPDRKCELQLVDLDDSGRAPLIFDVLRLMVSVKMSPAKIHGRELWDAYVKGLHGKNFELPEFIQEVEASSDKEFYKSQQKILNKNIEDGKLDLKAYGLTDMSTAPRSLKIAGNQIIEQLKKTHPEKSFVDWGWKVHTTGGSQGMNRVWILLTTKEGHLSLREFKQMAPAATGKYELQADHDTRVNQVRKAYWKIDNIDNYSVVTVPTGQFLSRSRFVYPVNDAIKKAVKEEGRDLNDLSLYLANRLGQLHAQQPAGFKLLNAIEVMDQKDKVDVLDIMRKLRDDYIGVLESMMKPVQQ